jgi:hypothetical protein
MSGYLHSSRQANGECGTTGAGHPFCVGSKTAKTRCALCFDAPGSSVLDTVKTVQPGTGCGESDGYCKTGSAACMVDFHAKGLLTCEHLVQQALTPHKTHKRLHCRTHKNLNCKKPRFVTSLQGLTRVSSFVYRVSGFWVPVSGPGYLCCGAKEDQLEVKIEVVMEASRGDVEQPIREIP